MTSYAHFNGKRAYESASREALLMVCFFLLEFIVKKILKCLLEK